MQTTDILTGRCFAVSFAGVNTNKALHVGHLRSIVVGNAVASALTSAGAEVQRRSLIGDVGRRVFEAMAGYMTYHEGECPQNLGLSGDRFVELCSRDYLREGAQSEVGHDISDPNAEERKPLGDLADALMERWMQESAPERQLWRRMRGWVQGGHQRTLARLGVVIDSYEFESEAVPRAVALATEGLESGLLKREEGGAVIRHTGQADYPTMVLSREDGFPTEHARLLGAYERVLGNLREDEVYVDIAGVEWRPPGTALRELLTKLRPALQAKSHLRVFHESVTIAGRKMGSSTGQVVWIDDFLDEVATGPGVAILEKLSNGTVARADLADLLVRGTFLCSPASRPLAFDSKTLSEGRPCPGWTIAEAWCRAQDPQESGGIAPVARTAVLQSQEFRQSLRRAVEKHDVTSLARYLLNLSKVCLAAPTAGPAAAPILKRVLKSLGFLAGTGT